MLSRARLISLVFLMAIPSVVSAQEYINTDASPEKATEGQPNIFSIIPSVFQLFGDTTPFLQRLFELLYGLAVLVLPRAC